MSVMSLWVLGRCVVARWRVAVAVFLAVLAGLLVYVGSLPSEYTARSVVAFTPRLGAGVGAMELRALLPSYVTYISAPSTLEGLVGAAGVDVATLSGAVEAQVVSDTSNLALAVTLSDPAGAAKVANVLAAEVVRFAGEDNLLLTRVVARAVPSGRPSGPPRGLFGLAGVMVAALLGMAAAVVLERARPRVRTSSEVGEATGHAVIGRIPMSRRVEVGWEDPAFATAMRSLRARLTRQAGESPVRALVVTSSVPAEGKTTVAVALGVAVARTGTSVLVVDADMRQRGLSRRLGLRPGTGPGQRPGFDSLLRGESALEHCLRPGLVPGLSVLPTSVDANSSDLLAHHFSRVLDEATARFDLVIIDAPPLLVGGDDAEAIATTTDAALLVVARDTPAYLATEAATTLRTLGVNVLGAIANGARPTRLTNPQPTPIIND